MPVSAAQPLNVGLIAGEASGDLLGAELMGALREQHEDVRFAGIAGPQMQSAGCECWYPAEELAVMGLVEVLKHLPRLIKLRRELISRLRNDPPDVLVGIDAPDFNLSLEAAVRAAGVTTVHYVSPSIWAWRQRRVKLVRRAADLVLCLLPFEPDFYAGHEVEAHFVGHPLADRIPMQWDRSETRRALNLTDQPCLAVMPGSRSVEINHLMPAFVATMAWLQRQRPGLRFIIPAMGAAGRRLITGYLQQHALDPSPIVLEGRGRDAIGAADAVLCASGTATLEAALIKRPMVVAYRISAPTAAIMRTFRLLKIQHIALPNLLLGRELFPEFIQERVTPELLGPAVLNQLDAAAQGGDWYDACLQIHRDLARDASRRAAASILNIVNR